MKDSFGARSKFEIGGQNYEHFRLDAIKEGHVDRLPYSLKILLENLLRHEDGRDVTREDILALANWDPKAAPSTEISFTPGRVILQDFTGVPAVVDLAAMREDQSFLNNFQMTQGGYGSHMAGNLRVSNSLAEIHDVLDEVLGLTHEETTP